MKNQNTFKVASVQTSPVFLDKKATVDKVCELISKAAKKGAKVVVFPEAFIPAYPDWVWVIPPYQGALLNDLYAALVENSVSVPDKSTKKLCDAAKKSKVIVVIGINERNSEKSGSSLYNSVLYIGSDGEILGKHRKLVPTSAERLVWAQGEGNDLNIYDTFAGKIGGLICWENYMPLARYVMYKGGTQIYTAPTWDQSDMWLSSMKHIAKEGGTYVISSCIAMKFEEVPDKFGLKKFYPAGKEWLAIGNSVIVNPKGEFIAGPLKMEQDILYADIDLNIIASSKRVLDVAGHYDRPDVLKLIVNK